MTKPIARDPMYRKRAFDADIIELCVRWYITGTREHASTRATQSDPVWARSQSSRAVAAAT